MRAVIQRVSRAAVYVGGERVSQIGPGLVLLLGIGPGDTEKMADALLHKVIHLRIFEDPAGKLNLSLLDIQGKLMVISQFTLYADCRKGRRPSFTDAAPPDVAKRLYAYFCDQAARQGIPVAQGIFQAHMDVELVNQGPVTIILDSERDFG
jgi:D-tyrosyl-tRNA(Tyr) deacylase